MNNEYYVYVYIDPRDYTEFYYGKGKGNRKDAHLKDGRDNEKTRIINEIKEAKLAPIIRVIARDLTSEQALLIEKTLIWKLGKSLSNISTGMHAENFRPNKTLYKELWGFDFRNGIYFFNCGDDGKEIRKWEEFRKHGFITAGGGKVYSDAIRGFEIGDIACVYLSKHGYVGVGRILTKAVAFHDFKINNKSLREMGLMAGYDCVDRPKDKVEYLCEIEWVKAVDRKNAFFEKRSGLFTPISVKASMEEQKETISKISANFKIDIMSLLKGNEKTVQQGDTPESASPAR